MKPSTNLDQKPPKKPQDHAHQSRLETQKKKKKPQDHVLQSD